MTRSAALLSILLIGYVAGVTIEPTNRVARRGEQIQLMCKVRGVIKSCFWEINGNLFSLSQGGKYEPVGNLLDGECGVMTTLTEEDSGKWTCRVFVEGVMDKAETATTNVTLYAAPTITLNPSRLDVEADMSVTVNCTVADARPMPGIMWTLDDLELYPTSEPIAIARPEGKSTITSSLQYTFKASDHGKQLKCAATGTWLNVNDDTQAAAQLDVMFAPQPKAPMTLYGYGIGQSGDVVVNFTANPKPTTVFWQLDDETRINVEPFSPSPISPRYLVEPLRDVETVANTYEARLKIKSVEELDAKKTFTLVVESEISREPQEYVVRISTSPTPVPTGSVSGGGIAAIIIVLLAVLVVVGIVMYARNTGRWCFAGQNKAVGVSTKENDEEAGQAGVEHHNDDDDTDGDVKAETNQRQSLTHRLSSLYETLMSKAAPKKSASGERATPASAAANSATGATTPSATAAPHTEESKDGAVVYAELDLKTPADNVDGVTGNSSSAAAVRMIKEEATEYAEIVPVKAPPSPATAAE